MACRGVHFAITDEDLKALRGATTDNAIMDIIQEEIEERWEIDEGFVYETDKAWDAIHRCLTDGQLSYVNGTEPLRLCILGGEQLYSGEDYIVSLITKSKLQALADALAKVTPEFIKEQYSALPSDYGSEKSQDDFQYTWDWFSGLPAFFDRAAKADRHVIFTVDQ